ncbi:MAG: ComF family protein [Candidatus Marinamargulisbacteria bacterium]
MGFGTICYFCHQPTEHRFCDHCSDQLKPSFSMVPVMPNICLGGRLFLYQGAVKQVIQDVKFNSNFRLAQCLAEYYLPSCIPPVFFDVDAWVIVPSHWFRQLCRGRPHLPFLFQSMNDHGMNGSHWLKRVRYTATSVGLSRTQRRLNAQKNRFAWLGPSLVQRVTILDDVMTTGETLIEIARLLRSHGVHTVMSLVLAYQSNA